MATQKASRHAPHEIDSYLAALPAPERDALAAVRRRIHALVPEGTERVSYGIPIFRLRRDLLGLSVARDHCALHTMSPPLAERIGERFPKARVSGATVHFTPDDPLPEGLLAWVIAERVAEAE